MNMSSPGLLGKHGKFGEQFIPLYGHFLKMSENPNNREEAWLSLTKIIRQTDSNVLQQLGFKLKLMHTLKELNEQPVTSSMVLFVYSLLSRVNIRHSDDKLLQRVISKIVDFAVESNSIDDIRVASDVFALYFGNNLEDFLIGCITGSLIYDREMEFPCHGDVKFTTWRKRAHLDSFIITMFSIHSAIMKQCKTDFAISLCEWLELARRALQRNVNRNSESVYAWLSVLIQHAGTAAKVGSRRIASILMDNIYPSVSFYNAVETFVRILGVPSSEFFKAVVGSAERPLCNQEYGLSFADAVSSSLNSGSVCILHPGEIMQLQRKVCEEIFKFPGSIPAIRILNDLLSLDIILVPAAIEVAQSVLACSSRSKEVERELQRGRGICCAVSRPRLQTVVPFEKWEFEMQRVNSDFTSLLASGSGIKEGIGSQEGNDGGESLRVSPELVEPIVQKEKELPKEVSGFKIDNFVQKSAVVLQNVSDDDDGNEIILVDESKEDPDIEILKPTGSRTQNFRSQNKKRRSMITENANKAEFDKVVIIDEVNENGLSGFESKKKENRISSVRRVPSSTSENRSTYRETRPESDCDVPTFEEMLSDLQ